MLKKQFEKIYVLDTNIILNDVVNVEILSQKSSNLIIIPETVMDELDAKKSGFDEINFQARSFGRMLERANKDIKVTVDNGLVISRMYIEDKELTIDIVSKEKYNIDGNIDKHIINDRKILEIADDIGKRYKNTIFISNDVMCRLRGISLGLNTESIGKDIKEDVELYAELDYDSLPDSIELSTLGLPETVFGLCLKTEDGNRQYYYRSGNTFFEIDEKELARQDIKPKNAEQKIMSSLLLDNKHDIYVVDAKAGTGKNAISLSAAIQLLDDKQSVFDKIVYIRKTIISSDVDLGYLPGSLEEKMSGYLAPLYSTLEAIAMRKYGKRRMNEETSMNVVSEMINKYRITPMWQGHLRGATIRNAIVIYDECQNDSIADLKTTLSRMGENCIVMMIGCTSQIDSKYVNKHNNALTYMKNKIGTDSEIRIAGMILNKSVRSPIAEWTDNIKL